MSVLRGDCVEVMAGMDADSVDAIVCDPPYGLEFMGKGWDAPWEADPHVGKRMVTGWSEVEMADGARRLRRPSYEKRSNVRCRNCQKWRLSSNPCACAVPDFPNLTLANMVEYQRWSGDWATAALRVAKPGAYLLAFGGTRTVHRMTCALEDAGWVIRDMLVWAYAQGFPKSRASLKPAWEPIVMARKPGASRDLRIDECRIGYASEADREQTRVPEPQFGTGHTYGMKAGTGRNGETFDPGVGRWPANVILTDPILDGGWEGVVGGGWQDSGAQHRLRDSGSRALGFAHGASERETYPDTEGTYSRFFLIPKAPTRERVLSDGRRSPHPTQKPEALIRHLVNLVTPPDGLVLDPFLGSGTLGVVCEGLGVRWVGIEREPEYADWAEDRIADKRPEWAVA